MVELFILESRKSKRAARPDSDFTTRLNSDSVGVEGTKMVVSFVAKRIVQKPTKSWRRDRRALHRF